MAGPSERAAAALVIAVALSCSVASPATEVKEALAHAGPQRVQLPGGASAELERVRFSDVAVAMDGGRALVVAVVEAEGRVRHGSAEVPLAYVGRERFEMRRCTAARWCLGEDAFDALRGVLAAVSAAPREGAARTAAIAAWQVRVERDRAMVGEEYLGHGTAAPAPLRTRWELARDGAGWAVVRGR